MTPIFSRATLFTVGLLTCLGTQATTPMVSDGHKETAKKHYDESIRQFNLPPKAIPTSRCPAPPIIDEAYSEALKSFLNSTTTLSKRLVDPNEFGRPSIFDMAFSQPITIVWKQTWMPNPRSDRILRIQIHELSSGQLKILMKSELSGEIEVLGPNTSSYSKLRAFSKC